MPSRSVTLAMRWQDRFDVLILVSAAAAIIGVTCQTLAKTGPVHLLGLLGTAFSWLIFAFDAGIMLSVSPTPARWARGHIFELILLLITCPLWPLLLHRLLVLDLLPALTVLEATKLAKLVKVVHAMRHHGRGRVGGRLVAAAVVVAGLGVGVLVLTH